MSRTVAVIAVIMLAVGSTGTAGCSSTGAANSAAVSLTDLERQRLLSHFEMTSRWLLDEVADVNEAQLSFRPTPDSWSIMQVIDHVVVVAPIYWNDLQQAMKTAPQPGGSRWSDADILWYGIDRTAREKAIPTEVPRGQFRSLDRALDEYRRHHARLVDYIKTTNDDLRSHIVARQGSDAYQWALLISTHEQRHILQIREIKAHPKFPS